MAKKSNEVIAEQIHGLRELINEKFASNDSAHEAILAQTTKTNGRVTTLEAEHLDNERWKSRVTGALIIMNVIIVPVFLMFVQKYIK